MEQKSKKIDIKIIVIVIVVIIAIVEGIVIFASNKQTPKGLQAKDCIGTWESTKYKDLTMILYEGGTGKRITANTIEGGYTNITWEIKDNVLNISVPYFFDNHTTTGYKVENGIMTNLSTNDTFLLKKNSGT